MQLYEMSLAFYSIQKSRLESYPNASGVSWASPANTVLSPMLFSSVSGAQVAPPIVFVCVLLSFSSYFRFPCPPPSPLLFFSSFVSSGVVFFPLTFCSFCMAHRCPPRSLIVISPCFAYTAASWRTTGMYKAQFLTGTSMSNIPSHPHISLHYKMCWSFEMGTLFIRKVILTDCPLQNVREGLRPLHVSTPWADPMCTVWKRQYRSRRAVMESQAKAKPNNYYFVSAGAAIFFFRKI